MFVDRFYHFTKLHMCFQVKRNAAGSAPQKRAKQYAVFHFPGITKKKIDIPGRFL